MSNDVLHEAPPVVGFEPEPGKTYHFTLTGAARWLNEEPPLDVRCFAACRMCSGKLCLRCGVESARRVPCTHHIIERHGHGYVEVLR